MQKLRFVNGNNVEINLTSGNYGVTNWEGFSNIDLNIQTQQVPFHDGSVYLDGLLNERELTITLAVNDNNNLELRYELRRELISALNPKLGEGYLYYKNDYLERRIKVVPHLPIFENKNSNDAGTLKASITWTACDPYWEDVEETTVNVKNENIVIENKGDIPIKINALMQCYNAENPSIKNITENSAITINGNYSGNISVDTKNGEKSVKFNDMKVDYITPSNFYDLQDGNNIIVGRDGDSKLITSIDGINFKIKKYFPEKNLDSVQYIKEKNMYLIRFYNGTIQYSYNLENWETSELPTIGKIAYNKNYGFILVSIYREEGSQNGYLRAWKSDDLITWTPTITENLYSLSYQNDFFWCNYADNFILLTDNGFLYGKFDGTALSSGGSGYDWRSEVELPDNLILISDSYFWNWNDNEAVANSLSIIDLAYNSFLNILYGVTTSALYKCNDFDLTSWTSVFNFGFSTWGKLNYFNNFNIIRFSFQGGSIYSQDGENWNLMGRNDYFNYLDFNEKIDVYYFVSGNDLYKVKNNNWTLLYSVSDIDSITAINHFDNIIIIGTQSGKIYFSIDYGETWNSATLQTEIPTTPYGSITKFMKINDRYWANCGQCMISSNDLSNWTIQRTFNFPSLNSSEIQNFIYLSNFGSKNEFWCYVLREKIIVAAGDFYQEFEPYDDIYYVCYSELLERLIFTGYGNYILDSNLNFIEGDLSDSEAVIYSDEYKLAVSVNEDGDVFVSINGLNWVEIVSFNDFADLKSAKDKIIICGSNIVELKFAPDVNLISKLSANSNVNFQLGIGKNTLISVVDNDGKINTLLTYRQKYIGV